jgi:hypothetical protein
MRSCGARDPRIGYKDVLDVVARMVGFGLAHVETVRMPANNLLLVFEKRGAGDRSRRLS